MGSNVAVVVLDTLRHDAMDEFQWLDGLWFENAYSPSHWTIPAHGTIYTGRYPSETGIHAPQATFETTKPWLPEQLQRGGYTTRCYTANPPLAYTSGADRGFDEFRTPPYFDPDHSHQMDWRYVLRTRKGQGKVKYLQALWYCLESEIPTVRALLDGYRFWRHDYDVGSLLGGIEVMNRRVRECSFTDQEFLLLNIMEVHTPYHSPDDGDPVTVTTAASFRDTVPEADRIRAAYRESARYLGQTYRELHSTLREEFDYVITLGDHGEMLGEHGFWNHGYGLFPELVHVPLVVSGSDVPDSTETRPVSLVDVHETVASLCGITTDGETRGRDLLDDPAPRPLLTEYHGFHPWLRDQFEREEIDRDRYESWDAPLHGVVTEDGYAFETHDAGWSSDDGVDPTHATEILDEILSDLDIASVGAYESDREVDEGFREQLEALGYA